jgi:acetyl esterase/lipase
MTLEKGINRLVDEFIAAGRPSSREQNIDDRRAGYVASVVLAGAPETRVQVEDIALEGMTFRVVSPLDAEGALPTVIYYHGGCFISGGFATHDRQLRQLAYESRCRVIAVQYRLAPEHTFPAAHDDAQRGACRRQRRRPSGPGYRPAPESRGRVAARAANPDLPDAGRHRPFGKLRQQRRRLHHHPGYAA